MGIFEMSGAVRRATAVTGALVLLATAGRAAAQADPDFDAVAWSPAGCAAAELVRHASPAGVDLAGDATFPAVYLAHDDRYAYFRLRLGGSPAGPGGFASYSWTALMQVPSGDPFQYQYQLSLDGVGDRIELWANTVAEPIDFSPLFRDASEVRLFSMDHDATGGIAGNTTPLARTVPAADGSSFGGDPDHFLDFAMPVAVLVAQGAIADASDLDAATWFPATSTNPNNYNKATLSCAFLPSASLSLETAVAPAVLPAGVTTPLAYTLTVANSGPAGARGLVVEGAALPAWVAGAAVTVVSSDPAVTWSVDSLDPFLVRASHLPVGSTLTVTITADGAADCATPDALYGAGAFASNAPEVRDATTLAVGRACDDGDGCTLDACTAGTCTHVAQAGCTTCTSGADCTDGDPCTTDVCSAAGVCEYETLAACPACAGDADCTDGDACTQEECGADGSCAVTVVPGCLPCAADADCDDGDPCTADACVGGACTALPLPNCVPVVEECGNCIDDDGDGLVDYEDADCCAVAALEVRRLRLRPGAEGLRGARLRVKMRDAGLDAAVLDPSSQDVTLQVSDEAGAVFCRTVAAEHWTRPRRRMFKFKDRAGAFAGGLGKGAFKVRRDGRVVFAAKGKRLALPATDGQGVVVTLRVGAQCAQAGVAMRAHRNVRRGLVFP